MGLFAFLFVPTVLKVSPRTGVKLAFESDVFGAVSAALALSKQAGREGAAASAWSRVLWPSDSSKCPDDLPSEVRGLGLNLLGSALAHTGRDYTAIGGRGKDKMPV